MVSVDNLSVTYQLSGAARQRDSFTAVKNISLDLPKGQIIGLVGESGSGKTSLGKALLGPRRSVAVLFGTTVRNIRLSLARRNRLNAKIWFVPHSWCFRTHTVR
ncbi:ATP-binding cassette domain-containing protein [Aliamphritea spongicola]|nr:ATP-binding cassette domain-containing protein [Aliamphritea spongicola]